MASTSGSQLLPQDAINNLRRLILPLTTILTPNIPEAELLLNDAEIPIPELESLKDLVALAVLVQKLGPTYVLLKGGHMPLDKDDMIAEDANDSHYIVNVLCSSKETIIFCMDYQASKNTHGTGCSLACKPSSKSLPFSSKSQQ